MIRNLRSLRDSAWMASVGMLLAVTSCAAQSAPATPPCAPWVEGANGDHSNREPVNLGCTNRSNLEQMLEDKHDLERGRTLGPADAERASDAVKNYEEDKVKETPSGGASSSTLILPTTTTSSGGQ